MKHGWEYRRLIDVCAGASTINWDTASSKQYIDLSSVDRESHKVSDTTTICKADAPSRAKQIVKMGDVIFGTTRPLLKRVCLVAPEYDKQVCSTGFCVLRPQKMVLPMWVYYCLQTDRFYSYIEPLQKGISYPAVSNDDVRNYVIPLPPLPVQKQICSLLDKLSRVIEAKKEQLKELDNLAQAIFYDMFGDTLESAPTKCLKDVAEYYIGLTYSPKDVADNGTVVLRSSNIQGNVLDFEDTVRVNMAISDKKIVQDGDILMCARNGSARLVGKVARIKNLSEKMSFGAFMTIIRSPYNDFLFQFFISHYFRNQLITSKTATINQITTKMLDGIKLNVPSLEQQQSFAEKVEAIERQKELINQSIREVQTLFDSRMDYWFSD